MRASISVMLVFAACTGAITQGDDTGDDDDTTPDAGAGLEARAKFDRDVLPIVTELCARCHAGSSDAWMANRPDAYTSMFAWPRLIDTRSPTSSMLLSKGNHSGPALGPEDQATILAWIKLEGEARAGRPHNPETDPLDVINGTNTLPLDALGAVGSNITFTAQRLPQGLYLSKIVVTAGTGGVHLTHPLFVTWQGDIPSPDPVDSFDTVELDIAAGTAASIGGGLLMLASVPAGAKLSVAFQKIGPANGGGPPPLSGCKALASFTANARAPLSLQCVSCHDGTNSSASSATDMTTINDTSAAGQTFACGQILGRVDLVTPASSGIFIAPDPASGASHPFKLASQADLTAFQTSLSTWIAAEKAAP